MRIDRFEDIEAWQPVESLKVEWPVESLKVEWPFESLKVEWLARELTQKVYSLTKKPVFAKDYGLKRQIQDAAGSSMHNIAEGFDSETNAEFIRFLRYAKRSCTEVQSELYVALDAKYISQEEFKDVYEQARWTSAAIRGFINYFKKYEEQNAINREPLNRWTNGTSSPTKLEKILIL